MACFVEYWLKTFSSRTSLMSSSILPSSIAALTRASIFFTSFKRRFLEADGFASGWAASVKANTSC